jgi:hypothetical protein
MNERDAKAAWDLALGDRAEHELDCTFCTPAWSPALVRLRCPIGVRLGDVEQAAYQAWSAARRAGVTA